MQSNGAGASASEAVEAMEAADNVAGLQQKDQRDYQKSKGQKISRGIFHRGTVSDWVPKKDSANSESDAFL